LKTRIQTQRLQLVALTRDQLQLLLDAPEQLARELAVPLSPDIVTDPTRRAIGLKLAAMAAEPAGRHPWTTYWLVIVSAKPLGAGLLGFKGYPDGDGQAEIGFGIAAAHRRRGYTTEAVRALIAWAFHSPACQAILAETRSDNLASQGVLCKASFHRYGQTDGMLLWRIDKSEPGRTTPNPSNR
jgi:RimJ/RimL family protein N-acetyltransferase